MNINELHNKELQEKLEIIKSIAIECNRTIIFLKFIINDKQIAIDREIKKKNNYEKQINKLQNEINKRNNE